MLRKLTLVILISLLMNALVFASKTDSNQDFAEKVKSKIAKLGTGTKSKVSIKLKGGSKLKGYISEIKADSFVITNEKANSTSEVSYSQVEQVKKNSLSKGQSTALGIGVGAVLVVGLLYLLGKATEGR